MSRRFWTDFLNLYISMPCLWKVKSKDYNNRDKRNACYKKLAEMCGQIDPDNATREFVVKKINSLRTAFRKEYRRVMESKNSSGGTPEVVHTPSLWYFEILLPTADQQSIPICEEDTEYVDGETIFEEHVHDPDTECDSLALVSEHNAGPSLMCQSSPIPFATVSSVSTLKRKNEEKLTFACKKLRPKNYGDEDDEYDGIGRNLAAKLRVMNKEQCIIAEKLVSDVLFHGQFDSLTRDSYIAIP